jgi:hypothetical protein
MPCHSNDQTISYAGDLQEANTMPTPLPSLPSSKKDEDASALVARITPLLTDTPTLILAGHYTYTGQTSKIGWFSKHTMQVGCKLAQLNPCNHILLLANDTEHTAQSEERLVPKALQQIFNDHALPNNALLPSEAGPVHSERRIKEAFPSIETSAALSILEPQRRISRFTGIAFTIQLPGSALLINLCAPSGAPTCTATLLELLIQSTQTPYQQAVLLVPPACLDYVTDGASILTHISPLRNIICAAPSRTNTVIRQITCEPST